MRKEAKSHPSLSHCPLYLFTIILLLVIYYKNFYSFAFRKENLIYSLPVTRSVISARNSGALLLFTGCTWVGCKSLSKFVGFPDVELSAARTILTSSGVDCDSYCQWIFFSSTNLNITLIYRSLTIIGRGFPSTRVSLAVNPFDIMRALGVTVASAVFSSTFVTGIFGNATINIHVNLFLLKFLFQLLVGTVTLLMKQIITKYRAPFRPHSRVETSTSKVNSLFRRLNIRYLRWINFSWHSIVKPYYCFATFQAYNSTTS